MKISKMIALGMFGGGGAAAPLALGAVSWWDASDLSTLFQLSNGTTPASADGDRVGYMADKINGTYTPVQATAGNRLTLKLAIKNGKSVLRSATGQSLATAAPIVAGMAYTLFMAFKVTSGSLPWYNGSSGANGYGLLYDANYNLLFGGAAGKTDGARSAVAEVVVTSHTSGASLFYVNGVAKSLTNAATNPVIPPTVATRLGTDVVMDFYECFLLDRAATAAEVALGTAYLSAKWAIP